MPFVHHHAPQTRPAAGDICLMVQGDRLLAASEARSAVTLPLSAAVAALPGPAETPMYIGLLEGRPCWALAVPSADVAAPTGWEWHDTRALFPLFTPAQAHAVSCARQLLWWDRRHRFCGACGTPTVESVEERARRCPSCGAVFFPVASPAIIVAVTRGEELLLAHNRNFRAGVFSLLAGFVDPGETLEQAVAREVREEVGIEVGAIEYVKSQPWSFPNSLMLGFRAQYMSGELKPDQKEIERAGWYTRRLLPDIPRRGTVARELIDAWIAEQPG